MVAIGKHTIISGLDVGTTKVCCLVGEIGADGNLEIIGKGMAPSLGVKKGVVVDIGETVKSIRAAVAEAERGVGFKLRSVFVGVTGDHVSSVNSHGVITLAHESKEIVEEDVRRAVEAAKVVSIPSEREVVHVIPRGFTIDGQNGVKNPVGMLGMRLEANTHIVTGVITVLHNLTKCVEMAGLEIEENGLVLEPLASSLSVLNDADKEMGMALLDIGGGTTDVAVYKNRHICHTAVLPIGGNHITYDLAVAFKLSPEEAERVKIAYGSAAQKSSVEESSFEITTLAGGKETKTREELTEVVAARVGEIFNLAKREISGQMNGSSLAGVTLTGGTSLLPGITEVAQGILGLPVRVGSPEPSNGPSGDALRTPAYSCAVGLLIYGATQLKNQKVYARRETFLAKAFKSLFKEFI